jgi:deoxyribonuclease V
MIYSPRKAKIAQKMMAELVKETPFKFESLKRIAGVDIAYRKGFAVAVAVLTSVPKFNPVETSTLPFKIKIPYIPGLLGFRETPIMVKTVKRFKSKPDVVLVDGHGIAHPRRFGSACHVGIILDSPTIGVAKSRLHGIESEETLLDDSGKILASILKDHKGKPYYVSVGHKISLPDAVTVTGMCMGDHGPIPLRLAHLKTKEALQNL